MSIHVDIFARLHERTLKQEAENLASSFDRAGTSSAARFGTAFENSMARQNPKIQRAINNVQNSIARADDAMRDYMKTQSRASATADELAKSQNRLDRATRAEADAHRSVASAIREHNKGLIDLKRNHRSALSSFEETGNSLQAMAGSLLNLRLAGPAGTIALVGIAKAAVDVGSVAVTASQALALLPAAAAAAGAGMGTLALATQDFSQAMKDIRDPEKFAADLVPMATNAQQAALAIQNLLPQFDGLKKATQGQFFAGISDQIQNLSKIYLPSIQAMTTGIAGAFNTMMTDVGNQLATPATQAQLKSTMDNITAGFQNAAPAARELSQAFIDIMQVGSEFLPGLGTGIANLATEFANFIRNARETGELKTWIQEGITAAEELAIAIGDLVRLVYEAFGSDAQGNIQRFHDDVQSVREVVSLLSGDMGAIGDSSKNAATEFRTSWQQELDGMYGPMAKFRDAVMDIPEAFMAAINGAIDGVNFFIDHFNTAVKGSMLGKLLDAIPGGLTSGSLNIPQIPHAPSGGDWSGHQGPIFGRPQEYDRFGQPLPMGPTIQVGPHQPNRTSLPTTGGPPGPPPGQQFPYTAPQLQPNGQPLSDKDRRDAIRAGLDPSLYRVDPFAAIPGMPGMPTAGVPAGPGAPGPGGLGTNVVDQQQVVDQQHNVETQAHDLEEIKKDRLALERDNTATAEEINDAKWKEHQAEFDLYKAQRELIDAQNGTWKKAKDQTNSLASGMGEIGVALDQDLGISKGLPGLAENLVKFLGNIAAAPFLGPMAAAVKANEQATGITGGYGLIGMLGAQNLAASGNVLGMGNQGQGQGPTAAPPGSGLNLPPANVNPSILSDTGRTPSGPQSRQAAALIQQYFGNQIRGSIGGSRDTNTVPGTHDTGTSIDIPIGADQGALGDQIRDFLQTNAQALGLVYTIWRDQGINAGSGGIPSFTVPGHQNHIDAHFNGQGGTTQGVVAPNVFGPSASLGSGSIPIPLPVTIVGGGGIGDASGWSGLGSAAGGGGRPGAPGTSHAGGPGAPAGGGGGGTPPAGFAGPGGIVPPRIGNFGAEGWRGTVASVVDKYGPQMGITPANRQQWIDAIVKQIDTESKGNPIAGNPNDPNGQGGTQSVSGLLQYLPSSYAASGGKLTGLPYMDPVGQIAGALFAPRTATGAPDTSATGGIGAGHGWGPAAYNPGPPAAAQNTMYTPDQAAAIRAQADQAVLNNPAWNPAGIGDFPAPSPHGGRSGAHRRHGAATPIPGNFNPNIEIDFSNIRPPGHLYRPGGPRATVNGGRPMSPFVGGPGIPPGIPVGPGNPPGQNPLQVIVNAGGITTGPVPGQQPPGGPAPFNPIAPPSYNPWGGTPTGTGQLGPLNIPPVGGTAGGIPAGAPGGPGSGPPPIGGGGGIPAPIGGGGGGGGIGSAAGTPIGGLSPGAPNPGGGGVSMTPGGSLDTAVSLAASAADIFAPGAGQAIQIGVKEANRAIQYAGQVAGIGVSGLMETFLPTGGSELANNNWLTRLAGGLAGASPALPNVAGGGQGQQQQQQITNAAIGSPAPVAPGDVSTGQGTGSPPGPVNNLEYHNHEAQPGNGSFDHAADKMGQMQWNPAGMR